MEKNTSKAQVAPALMSPIGTVNGAGSPLFVINLCASIAPVQVDSKNIPGLDNYRLYQVARVEDGRTRHRLRLGFFTSESHAESVLAVVRQQYPTAFTACLCDEDRRFARGYLPDSHGKAAPAAATTATKPASARALTDSEIIELTWEPDEKPKAKAATAPSAAKPAPAPAAKKPVISVDAGLDEFTWEPPALQASTAKVAASTSDTSKQPIIRPALNTKPVIKAATPAKPAAPAKPAIPPKPIAAAPTAKPASKVDTATSMRVPALQLSLSSPPAHDAPQAKSNGSAQPFHVGKGVHIAETGIRLQAEPSAAPAAKTPPKATTVAAAKVNGAADKGRVPPTAAPVRPGPGARLAPSAHKPSQVIAPVVPPAPHKPAPIASAATTSPVAAPRVPQAVAASSYIPELDSTQTIRALTSAELHDEQQEKWFAVQLAASEHPVNLDAMPRLDIFEAYRLYSVATAGSGKIVHSLRLGFFKEAVSAEAVGGYLKTFFGSPTVLRVSVAEHARFKDAPVKKTNGEKHEAKVVELNNARSTRSAVPTVTVEVDSPAIDPAATGSFKVNATGSFKVDATGTHTALKTAAKGGGPATKRSAPMSRPRTGNTGKHKVIVQKKSLAEELLDEARQVELSASGIRKLPKNDSLLSRLVDKLKK